jgi:hypothetical protein
MADQPGFFDAHERLRRLSAAGDPLERLKAVVDSSCSAPIWRRLCPAPTAVVADVHRMMRC